MVICTRPFRFGSAYDIWLPPSAKSPMKGASFRLQVFFSSTDTPGLWLSVSASEISGFRAPKSNWRMRLA